MFARPSPPLIATVVSSDFQSQMAGEFHALLPIEPFKAHVDQWNSAFFDISLLQNYHASFCRLPLHVICHQTRLRVFICLSYYIHVHVVLALPRSFPSIASAFTLLSWYHILPYL